MYGGFEVYKTYLAVKLHFTSPSYDYIKYEGKVNAKLDTFTSRNDRYFFHKLSTRYKQDEILDFFVANFAKDDKKWVKSLLENDGKGNYLEYKKYQDAVGYHFRNDCSSLANRVSTLGIRFNDGFRISGGQHHQFCVYLYSGRLISRPPSFLIQFYRIVKIGLKIFLKELYGLKSHLRWPS